MKSLKYSQIVIFKQEPAQHLEMKRVCDKFQLSYAEFIRYAIQKSLDKESNGGKII